MKVDRFFSVFKTAGEGMSAQRRQLQMTAENIANANTSRVEETGDAYRPKVMTYKQTEQQNYRISSLKTSLALKHTRTEHIDGRKVNMGRGENMDSMSPDQEITEQEKFRYEYDPTHPDSDANGMVKYPDLDLVAEMTSMITANRLFEANLSVVEAEKQNIKRAFEI
jgi:flagellar basal-body rod protein FlgC